MIYAVDVLNTLSVQAPRDPRFLPLTGEFSEQKFHSQYRFLSEMHTDEMRELKDNLKRARKLLTSSPRELREEREQEVQRLERAFKRAESMVHKDRRERVEREALDRVATVEREQRKAGKGAWHMKDGTYPVVISPYGLTGMQRTRSNSC